MTRKAPSTNPKLEQLIEEATVDAYGPAEQATGFYTMIDENVPFPFKAKAIGEDVVVVGVDLDEDGEEVVAKCRRRGRAYTLRLTELEIPTDVPGRDWIAAYFQFMGKELG